MFSLFTIFYANAQVSKGDVLIGGSFGYNSYQNQGNNSNSNANVSPRVGYAIGKNSVLSARVSASFSKSTAEVGDYKNTNSFVATGIGWRKYYPIKNKFGLYSDLNGNVGWGRSESTSNTGVEYESNFTNYNVGLTPGLYYHVTPGILLGADFGGFGVSHNRTEPNSGRTTAVYLNLLSTFTFGVDFILGKKNS